MPLRIRISIRAKWHFCTSGASAAPKTGRPILTKRLNHPLTWFVGPIFHATQEAEVTPHYLKHRARVSRRCVGHAAPGRGSQATSRSCCHSGVCFLYSTSQVSLHTLLVNPTYTAFPRRFKVHTHLQSSLGWGNRTRAHANHPTARHYLKGAPGPH